jgi:hypothetical protein
VTPLLALLDTKSPIMNEDILLKMLGAHGSLIMLFVSLSGLYLKAN